MSDSILAETKKTRRKKYIPGLAAFKHTPKGNWTWKQAKELYEEKKKTLPVKGNQVFYEDSISGMRKLPDKSIDMIFADPPFGIDFSGKEELYNRDSSYVVDEYNEVEGDYGDFSERWISELPRIMKETASAYIVSGWTNLESVLAAARKSGLKLINHIIWNYQFGPFTKIKYVSSHYHILFLAKNEEKYYFNKIEHYAEDTWLCDNEIWNLKREYRKNIEKNGTKLPVGLVQKCIDYGTEPGDLVLDPFMGNGTTAEASKGSFRYFIGFEINSKLRNIIQTNIDQMKFGKLYRQYGKLKPIEQLKKKYPRAYKIYKNEQK